VLGLLNNGDGYGVSGAPKDREVYSEVGELSVFSVESFVIVSTDTPSRNPSDGATTSVE
jgi:hypothetical protein